MTSNADGRPSPGQRAPLSGFDRIDTSGMSASPWRGSPPDELRTPASRTLDPEAAVRFADQPLQPTVYHGSRLLVRPTADRTGLLEALTSVAGELGYDVRLDPEDARLADLVVGLELGPDDPQPLLLRLELLPRYADGPAGPPDAWLVLQRLRSRFPEGAAERNAVQLDHVVSSHMSVTGTPFWRIPGTESQPFWRIPGTALGEYGIPGSGGRTPVAWLGPEPVRTPDDALAGRRRPVVAVLDTGVGSHRWFPEGVVDRTPTVGGLRIGLTDPATEPENPSVAINPLVGQLDPTAGHGTFIAGLIRQKCPDATLLAVRVLQGDTTVPEAELLRALDLLWLRQRVAIAERRPELLVDVVSLSLGYYHETPADAAFDPLLLAPVRALGRLGVVVVASSGNDATLRPMYPAAFAPYPKGAVPRVRHDEVPVVAVGATNPDRSVALFSNEGPWVSAHRPGASLVSTLPPFDSAEAPRLETVGPDGVRRATLDPDDYTAGFGVWSGTSFAAPVLAGEIAQYLHASGSLAADDVDPAAALDRGWAAVHDRVPSLVRPAAPAPSGAKAR